MSEETYPKGTMQALFDDDPSTWTQGAYARDKGNAQVGSENPRATSWCLMGALHKCYLNNPPECNRVYERMKNRVGKDITAWNDYKATFEEVKALVKELNI